MGYAVRFDEKCSAEARVRVMTDGMLLREAMVDDKLKRYSVVILDEAHERTVQTDILIALLRDIQRKRKSGKRPLRLVIMSATLNPEIFMGYFGLDISSVLYIEGRQYPVKLFYTRTPVEDFLEAALQAILKIISEHLRGDILVFLDGQEAIESLKLLLKDRAKQMKESLCVLPLYAALNPRHQMRVFEPAKPTGARKVILATNIAETSLTIPGVTYVVDSGLHKVRTYDANRSLSRLQSVPISRASSRQRMGRAGRERSGFCYRLFTEDTFFDEMREDDVSEVLRCNLSSVMLTLITLGVKDLVRFPYLERPSLANIEGALEELLVLGALDNTMSLTPIGRQMSVFPLDPSLSKVLIEAQRLKCFRHACCVAALIVATNIFVQPSHNSSEERTKWEEARNVFKSSLGDHLTLRNIMFEYWRQKPGKHRKKWCKSHYLNERSLENADNVYKQLVEYAQQVFGFIPDDTDANDLEDTERDYRVLQCVLSGFYRNVALLNMQVDGRRGTYHTLTAPQEIIIHPSSVLSNSNRPPFAIVFGELVITTKHYARDVSIIDRDWLSQCVPKFFRPT